MHGPAFRRQPQLVSYFGSGQSTSGQGLVELQDLILTRLRTPYRNENESDSSIADQRNAKQNEITTAKTEFSCNIGGDELARATLSFRLVGNTCVHLQSTREHLLHNQKGM